MTLVRVSHQYEHFILNFALYSILKHGSVFYVQGLIASQYRYKRLVSGMLRTLKKGLTVAPRMAIVS